MKNNKLTYLGGLHRPFNIPLKEITWVCDFISCINTENVIIKRQEFYIRFYVFFLKAYIKHQDTLPTGNEWLPSIDNVQTVLSWVKQKFKIEKIDLEIQNISHKKNKIELDKKIYTEYKRSTYFITLTKKLKFITNDYKLNEVSSDLLKSNRYFFKLTRKEKDIIFRQIIINDFDYIVPMIVSLPYNDKIIKSKRNSLHYQYLNYKYGISFYKYIEKSQIPNYDKVRMSWLLELNAIDKKNKIRKHYRQIILSLNATKYNNYEQDMIPYLDKYVKHTNKEYYYFSIIEKSYNELIKAGKHDLGFVNLYDIKKSFRLSHDSFQKLLNSYYDENANSKIILFSNIVNSIDGRKRFIIKNTTVLKIRIVK